MPLEWSIKYALQSYGKEILLVQEEQKLHNLMLSPKKWRWIGGTTYKSMIILDGLHWSSFDKKTEVCG